MEFYNQTEPLTFEKVWASIQESNRYLTEKQAETDRLIKEHERYLTEKQAETDRLIKENERYLKELFAETDKKMQETDRIVKENALSLKETERFLKEQYAETKEGFAESRKLSDENAQRMKELQKELGGMGNSHGSFAEEYFFTAFENKQQNFFGERFDEIDKNLKPKNKDLKDEYDIVLYNCSSVAIIEVKWKAERKDIRQVLKKAETFKKLCSGYENYKIYLGFASLYCPAAVERECIGRGIAVIKQVGDAVVINDTNLKAF
jgi:hypothetical protein